MNATDTKDFKTQLTTQLEGSEVRLIWRFADNYAAIAFHDDMRAKMSKGPIVLTVDAKFTE